MFKVKVPEELKEGFPLFIERRFQDLESLKKALSKSNFDEVYEIGHRMKGNGSTYGFVAVTEIGDELMKATGMDDKKEQQILDQIQKFECAINTYQLIN